MPRERIELRPEIEEVRKRIEDRARTHLPNACVTILRGEARAPSRAAAGDGQDELELGLLELDRLLEQRAEREASGDV